MAWDKEDIKKVIAGSAAMGSGPILKAIGKFLPGIGSFVSGAYTAGYAADQILDFVKSKLESPDQRRNREQLSSRAEQGIARPDEQAALSQIEQQQSPLNEAMGLGKLGAQALGGFASARAGAKQQEIENEQKQQQINQQGQAQEQNQARQAQQDQIAAIRQQSMDIRNKENLGFKQRAEERSIEKHNHSLKKSSVKASLKKKIPTTFEEALQQIDEFINGI